MDKFLDLTDVPLPPTLTGDITFEDVCKTMGRTDDNINDMKTSILPVDSQMAYVHWIFHCARIPFELNVSGRRDINRYVLADAISRIELMLGMSKDTVEEEDWDKLVEFEANVQILNAARVWITRRLYTFLRGYPNDEIIQLEKKMIDTTELMMSEIHTASMEEFTLKDLFGLVIDLMNTRSVMIMEDHIKNHNIKDRKKRKRGRRRHRTPGEGRYRSNSHSSSSPSGRTLDDRDVSSSHPVAPCEEKTITEQSCASRDIGDMKSITTVVEYIHKQYPAIHLPGLDDVSFGKREWEWIIKQSKTKSQQQYKLQMLHAEKNKHREEEKESSEQKTQRRHEKPNPGKSCMRIFYVIENRHFYETLVMAREEFIQTTRERLGDDQEPSPEILKEASGFAVLMTITVQLIQLLVCWEWKLFYAHRSKYNYCRHTTLIERDRINARLDSESERVDDIDKLIAWIECSFYQSPGEAMSTQDDDEKGDKQGSDDLPVDVYGRLISCGQCIKQKEEVRRKRDQKQASQKRQKRSSQRYPSRERHSTTQSQHPYHPAPPPPYRTQSRRTREYDSFYRAMRRHMK